MFCTHNRRKGACGQCGGSAFCEHNKRKAECRKCDGSSFCMHDKRKAYCKQCSGSSFCEHNKRKADCRQCSGSAFCEHNKRKADCRQCDGSAFCEHNKRKAHCRQCGGSAFCEHNKLKAHCRQCAPIGARNFCQICTSTMLSKVRLRQGITMCAQCDTEVPQRTEHWIRDQLLKMGMFPPSAMDDVLFGGKECSMMNKRRRPDLIWVTNDDDRVLIVEVDENSHLNMGYQPSCESSWISDMADVCGVLGKTAPHIIRFNPDAYDGGNVNINVRLEALYEKIEHFLTKPYEPQNEPSVEYMYYHSSARKYIDHAIDSGGINVLSLARYAVARGLLSLSQTPS